MMSATTDKELTEKEDLRVKSNDPEMDLRMMINDPENGELEPMRDQWRALFGMLKIGGAADYTNLNKMKELEPMRDINAMVSSISGKMSDKAVRERRDGGDILASAVSSARGQALIQKAATESSAWSEVAKGPKRWGDPPVPGPTADQIDNREKKRREQRNAASWRMNEESARAYLEKQGWKFE